MQWKTSSISLSSNRLHVGDTIRCLDIDDLIDTMQYLEELGVHSDFDYSEPGRRRLCITGIEDEAYERMPKE